MYIVSFLAWAACELPTSEPVPADPPPTVADPAPAAPEPAPAPEPSGEAGEPAAPTVAVTLEKMNVLYIGVDNPLSVSVSGGIPDDLSVTATSGQVTLRRVAGGDFLATASTPGPATITVSGGDLPPTSFDYRVKRIPDPIPNLANQRGGPMGTGEFKAQGGLMASLPGFDFDATCSVVGFELVHLAKRTDGVMSSNAGPRYNAKSRRLVNQAKPGDRYVFDNIRAKCPGDSASRRVGSLAFSIH